MPVFFNVLANFLIPMADSFLGPLATVLTASVLAAVATGLLLRMSVIRNRFIDSPVERSLHSEPTPRLGGIAIWLSVGLTLWLFPAPAWTLSGCLAVLWLVSLADDRRPLGIGIRLGTHFLMAGVVIWHFTAGLIGPIWLLILPLVWMTNLFNFMDGSDGLAGSMAVIGFTTYALAAGVSHPQLTTWSLAIAGSCAGFLLFNFPQAKTFMGDSGSIPLGFATASLGLWGVRDNVWPFWFPILTFLPFLVDATWTLIARAIQGERFWQAHRRHLYQRLVLAGMPPSQLLVWSASFMVLSAGIALVARALPATMQSIIVGAYILVAVAAYAYGSARLAAKTK